MALFTPQHTGYRGIDTSGLGRAGRSIGDAFSEIGESVAKAIEKHKLDKIEQEMKPQFIEQAIKRGMDAETAEVAWKATSKSGRARGAEFMQSVNSTLQQEQQAESIRLNQESLRQQIEFFKSTEEARKKAFELTNIGKEAANKLASLNIKDTETQQKINEVINRIYPPELRAKEVVAQQAIVEEVRKMQGGVKGQAAIKVADEKLKRDRLESEVKQIKLMNAGELARQDAATLQENIKNDVHLVKFNANGVPKISGDLAGASPEYRQRVIYEAEKRNDERTLRKLTAKGKQASIAYTQAMTRYQEKLLNSAKDKTSTEFERNIELAVKMGWIDKDTAKEYYLQRIDTQSGAPQDATEETKLKYAGRIPMATGLNLQQLSNIYYLAKSGGSDQATYDEKKNVLKYKYMGKDSRGNDKIMDGKIQVTPDLMGKINAFKAREEAFHNNSAGAGSIPNNPLQNIEITPQSLDALIP